jgi:tetratricopeptide (TPR) repeat protein
MNKIVLLLLFPLISFGQSVIDNAEQFISKKKYTKAQQILEPYVSKNSKDLKSIELLGDAYGFQKNWDDAIIQYKNLTELKPKNANYHYKYGGALSMKALTISKLSALMIIGDIKNAFLEAVDLDKNHIEARWALVELYMQLPGFVGGSKNKSLKYADELSGLSKVDGYLAKGYINEYDDEPELAEKFYKLAIIEGGSVTCFDKLTSLYESEDLPEKAIANIENAQQKHQRNGLHYQIGKVCAEYNVQLKKGEQCLNNYIKNYSAADGVPKAWANYRLAQIHKHKGNKVKALKYIDLAISELPDIKPFKVEKDVIISLE